MIALDMSIFSGTLVRNYQALVYSLQLNVLTFYLLLAIKWPVNDVMRSFGFLGCVCFKKSPLAKP